MSGYIKPLSDKVIREKVTFPNRFGTILAGDLYYAKTLNKKTKVGAIIVGAPYGGVKEQVCVYGDELAQRGFVVLTFDQIGMGDSKGEGRQVASPELFTESFSAAVDYLGTKVAFVDREKIGVIGICGGAAFALSAAAMDPRIKAVSSIGIIDMSQLARQVPDKTVVASIKDKLAKQRWVDAEAGKAECKTKYPEKPVDEIPDGLQPLWQEFFAFYGLERGWHKNSIKDFTTTSNLVFLNANLLNYIDEISPRPILFITGDKDVTKPFTDEIYKKAADPKELVVVEWAQHIDFYDNNNNIIPFDKLKDFFTKNLK